MGVICPPHTPLHTLLPYLIFTQKGYFGLSVVYYRKCKWTKCLFEFSLSPPYRHLQRLIGEKEPWRHVVS